MDFIFSRASHQHKHSERTPTRCTRQSPGLGLGRREGGKGYRGNDNEGYSDQLWDAGATKGGDRGNVNVSSQKINKTANGCFQPGVLPSGSHLGDAHAKKGWLEVVFPETKIQLFTKDRSYKNLAEMEVWGL